MAFYSYSMNVNHGTRPNTPLQPTPLRIDKIGAILSLEIAPLTPRSISAARLNGKPLGGCQEQTVPDECPNPQHRTRSFCVPSCACILLA